MNYSNKNNKGSVGILLIILVVVIIAAIATFIVTREGSTPVVDEPQTDNLQIENEGSEIDENVNEPNNEIREVNEKTNSDSNTKPAQQPVQEPIIENESQVSSPTSVYIQYKKDFEATTNYDEALAVMTNYATRELVKEFTEDNADMPEESKDEFYTFLKAIMTMYSISEITVEDESVMGNTATLNVSVSGDNGTVTLQKENNEWKIELESWKGAQF